jgi:DNA-binding CsgD family transcriptional regulator
MDYFFRCLGIRAAAGQGALKHPPVTPNRTAVWLVRRTDAAPAVYVLRRSGQVVGRSPICDVRIEHPSVSRTHADIRFGRGIWLIRDLGSKNGTFVDGERIDHAALESGSTVRFGCVDTEVVDQSRAAMLLGGLGLPSTVDGFEESQDRSQRDDTDLSPAELRVLRLLLTGQSEKQIAKTLCVSRHTVHNHISAIYRLLGVHSRAELMALHLDGRRG